MQTTPIRILFGAIVFACAGAASAQTATPVPMGTSSSTPATEFRFPESGVVPTSTLRMREIPQPGSVGQSAPRPVTDTPESVELYRLCQRNADRAATDIADMQGRIAGCLKQLDERRQQGY